MPAARTSAALPTGRLLELVGLDKLAERLQRYREQGARFAKWRAVYNVSPPLPGPLAVKENAHALARYAARCVSRRASFPSSSPRC